MEEEIIAYVNDETPLMSDPSSWSALAFISSPLIALLSLKIWVRMVRLQPKKRTACASECSPQCAGQIGEGQEPLHSAVYCHQIPRALNENHRANPAGRDLWKSLAQASAQSRASSKIWSGCSGPFSINTWKSPETAQLFWVILSRVWTHALGKKISFYLVGISLGVLCDCCFPPFHYAPRRVWEVVYTENMDPLRDLKPSIVPVLSILFPRPTQSLCLQLFHVCPKLQIPN